MSNSAENIRYPIVFVTGIGQTWATLRGSDCERWNLVPSSKAVAFDSLDKKDKAAVISSAAKTAASLALGKVNSKELNTILSKIMRCCIVDDNGNIPDDVDVRIYGARSLDVLGKTDFKSGKIDCNSRDTLRDRLIRDIPAEYISRDYGEENMYCFNYCSFSNLYDDAEKLHSMIEDVIEDQRTKTGADKVILVPMSMGATVVNAYLDLYYNNDGSAKGCNLVEKVISIVGAWQGSDALADLLLASFADDAGDFLGKVFGKKVAAVFEKIGADKARKLASQVIDCFCESVLFKCSSFMALVTPEKFEAVNRKLVACPGVTDEVKRQALRYHKAQTNLESRLKAVNKVSKVDFYFICGFGLNFGDVTRDFSFLRLTKSAVETNSDSVIQISSTAPGTSFVKPGTRGFKEGRYVSPEGDISAASSVFPDRCWYFEAQEHELGTNNTAVTLAGEIAMGRVDNIDDSYPQFNGMRNINGVSELLEKADSAVKSGKLPEERCNEISVCAEQVRLMMDNIVNNPDFDNLCINALKNELSDILF